MRIIFILLAVLVFSSCTSTPTPLNYYLLDNNTTAIKQSLGNNDGKTITLLKLQLAHYLENVHLPLLQHDHTIVYANQHVWAEPLALSIKRILVEDFRQYTHNQLRLKRMPNAKNSDYQLLITITHFSATDDSTVILVGSYWLNEKEYSFNFSRDLTADGFSQSVAQQRLLISDLVKMISGDLH
jgi:uncharacterized lipoprotein YmbA